MGTDEALTIGNAIMTGAASFDLLRPGLESHELQHTWQWAAVGMTGGLDAQMAAGMAYVLNVAVDRMLFGGRDCTVLAEIITEVFGDGGTWC